MRAGPEPRSPQEADLAKDGLQPVSRVSGSLPRLCLLTKHAAQRVQNLHQEARCRAGSNGPAHHQKDRGDDGGGGESGQPFRHVFVRVVRNSYLRCLLVTDGVYSYSRIALFSSKQCDSIHRGIKHKFKYVRLSSSSTVTRTHHGTDEPTSSTQVRSRVGQIEQVQPARTASRLDAQGGAG